MCCFCKGMKECPSCVHMPSVTLQAGKIWRPYAEAALSKSEQQLADIASVNSALDNGTSVMHSPLPLTS